MHKKYRVTLTLAEREELERMLARGKADVRKIKHAQILLKADEADGGPAWPDARIAEAFAAGITTVERVRQRFVEEGFASALSPYRGGKRIYDRKLDGEQEAHLIALACAAPPEGHGRWTLRLLARRMVELEHVDTPSHGTVRQGLRFGRCETPGGARHHEPYRPEAEGALVLPRHEFGLDVIALIGAWRYRAHKSVPEIHRALRERGVAIAERTVTHLLDRYDELVATSLADDDRLRGVLARQGRAILALDGLQPDVGHEVLWVVRDCLSGEVLLARSLLGATAPEVGGLLREVDDALPVPVRGVV